MGLSNVGWLFGVMDILQRYFRGYDIWPRRVNSQLQRAADSAFVGGEFSDLPLPLPLPLPLSLIKHLGARRVDNPVGFSLWVDYSQGETENPLEHQDGSDGLVGVELTAAALSVMVVVEPVVQDNLHQSRR